MGFSKKILGIFSGDSRSVQQCADADVFLISYLDCVQQNSKLCTILLFFKYKLLARLHYVLSFVRVSFFGGCLGRCIKFTLLLTDCLTACQEGTAEDEARELPRDEESRRGILRSLSVTATERVRRDQVGRWVDDGLAKTKGRGRLPDTAVSFVWGLGEMCVRFESD